ncbi:hypothetical protein SAMN04488024_12515 [Pedobacter soli]|uniref:Uncharacterized protein n=2 Tax=Pedobacter soli TaxID=390242 RepID=A0A1G7DDY1_9SPHI|nr:hypothetical protein SAMN04488024_12515 [Pedobacter soli]
MLAVHLQKDCNVQQDGTYQISTGFALLKKNKIELMLICSCCSVFNLSVVFILNQIFMIKKTAWLLLIALSVLSCKKNKTKTDCRDKMCTYEFRSVGFRFMDNKGEGAEVKDFSVINQRTGEKVMANSSMTSNLVKGAFIIADDGNVRSLSEQGDNLKITGTSVQTNQTKSAVIKVSGGECACHIAKLSGPDQIAFD